MKDLMIDLETFGTGPKSVVTAIGACFFDIEKGKIGNTFDVNITFEDQLKVGRKLDESTVMWWLNQSDEARSAITQPKRHPTLNTLQAFSSWIHANNKQVKVWGNGSTFDITIMESLYSDFELSCPWRYNNIMDLRTFRRFVANGATVPKSGVNHKALDDAISQASFVIEHYLQNKNQDGKD